jgi:hypothetical protein
VNNSYLNRYPLRYPWDQWFQKATKKPVKLVRGEHFPCQVHSMAVQVRTAASRRGLSVCVTIADDRVTLKVTDA